MIETPLLEVQEGVWVKLELNNPGGSHKVRAARFIIEAAIARGDIELGKTTVIEKTGGNFGFGLVLACAEHQIPVELAVGLGFSPIKRKLLAQLGATLIGIDMLAEGKTPKEVVQWHLSNQASQGKTYYYTDQFNNQDSVLAHEQVTGAEIARQLQQRKINDIVLVKCAGTGASLTGISRALLASGIRVQVVLVEPKGCDSRQGRFVDHTLEGMSVGVVPPFVDWGMIHAVEFVSQEEMQAAKLQFARSYGYIIGNTSAACLHVARQYAAKRTASSQVLSIIYDHGLWYLD